MQNPPRLDRLTIDPELACHEADCLHEIMSKNYENLTYYFSVVVTPLTPATPTGVHVTGVYSNSSIRSRYWSNWSENHHELFELGGFAAALNRDWLREITQNVYFSFRRASSGLSRL
jgi:hypothetical protein